MELVVLPVSKWKSKPAAANSMPAPVLSRCQQPRQFEILWPSRARQWHLYKPVCSLNWILQVGGGTRQEHFMPPIPLEGSALLRCSVAACRPAGRLVSASPRGELRAAANHWLVAGKASRLESVYLFLSLAATTCYSIICITITIVITWSQFGQAPTARSETVCVQLWGLNCISSPSNVAPTTQTIPFC